MTKFGLPIACAPATMRKVRIDLSRLPLEVREWLTTTFLPPDFPAPYVFLIEDSTAHRELIRRMKKFRESLPKQEPEYQQLPGATKKL